MHRLLTSLATIFLAICASAQTSDKVRTGWQFGGALPAIAFNADEGFKYGALCNIYDYGDGSFSPDYTKSVYLEMSRTTKGSGINHFIYDDKKLLGSNVRFFVDINYLTEKLLNFYGFNGYQAYYNANFENDDNEQYISRAFYRNERKMLQVLTNLRNKIGSSSVYWYAGYIFTNQKIAAPDTKKLNKGKYANDTLPTATNQTNLFLKYIDAGIISQSEKNGGCTHQFQAGFIYDTRNVEAFPTKGMWNELYLIGSPSLSKGTSSYVSLLATVRQYFATKNQRLVLTYRASAYTLLGGKMPFYMLPFHYDATCMYNALGANKNMRGMLRNRVVGCGYAFANIETRYKFLVTQIKGQDLYLAASAFADAGQITQCYKKREIESAGFESDREKLHTTAGVGLHVGFNNNFIVAIDYGRALDKRDGTDGLYINIGWLW